MAKAIKGIQQIGVGVIHARRVYNRYKNTLGSDILIFEDEATAHFMLRYANGRPRDRYALLAMNMRGGGGLEIWASRSDIPRPPDNSIVLKDLGINAMFKTKGNGVQGALESCRALRNWNGCR